MEHETRLRGGWLISGRLMMVAALLASSAPTSLFAQREGASEYEIKAAFLYNFAKFVRWPAGGSWRAGDPLSICVVGDDPFGEILDETVRGKSVEGHKVVVRRLRNDEIWNGCQIAFIGSSQKNLPSILARAGPAEVLTVGEASGFAQLGGMINFVVEVDRVRFEVNVDAAERAGFKISSKLLSLAKIVRSQDPQGRI